MSVRRLGIEHAYEELVAADDDNGPRVACPHCDYLVPLRRAIGPRGRTPLTCPRCTLEVALPGSRG